MLFRSAYFPGLSAEGPSGTVLVPTAQVVRANWYAMGLHRGIIKAAYGLFGISEAGIVLPDIFDMPNEEDFIDKSRGFVKIVLDFPGNSWFIPGIGAGTENSITRTRGSEYAIATWEYWSPKLSIEGTVGYGNGRFLNAPFGGIGIVPGRILAGAMKFLVEYSAQKAAIGTRIALSKYLRLDFVLLLNATPPETFEGQNLWLIKIERGFLGASTTDQAFRPARKRTP